MWLIQKVRLNDAGEITHVQWQQASTGANAWQGQPEIAPVIEVVDAVLVGKVGSVVPDGRGGTTQGPDIRTIVGAHGVENIEADPSEGETRSLLDLPRL